MAFISQDWRDPGNIYVKSDMGHWEPTKLCRIRIFEMISENFYKRAFRQSVSESESSKYTFKNDLDEMCQNSTSCGFYQPHIIIKQISTKESAVLTSLSEALLALDFKVAIRDIRRFGYVCRVLQIFINDKLQYLSGRTQLYIIELLKEILRQVTTTQNSTNLLRQLLQDLESTLERNKYNHVGSSQLWRNHLSAVKGMNHLLKNLEFKMENASSNLTLESLPPECRIQILNNLKSPQDLKMTEQTCRLLENHVNDDFLWKRLVEIYFTSEQLESVNKTTPRTDTNYYWRFMYSKLLYKFGDGHYFPIKLGKCSKCSCVFWPIFGHPCTSGSGDETYKSLLPEDFVSLFDV